MERRWEAPVSKELLNQFLFKDPLDNLHIKIFSLEDFDK